MQYLRQQCRRNAFDARFIAADNSASAMRERSQKDAADRHPQIEC
jgi:hypothetical protein